MRIRSTAVLAGLALIGGNAEAQFFPQKPPQPAQPLTFPTPATSGSQPAIVPTPATPTPTPPTSPRAPYFPPASRISTPGEPREPRLLPIGPGMTPAYGPSPTVNPSNLQTPQPLQNPSEIQSPSSQKADPSVKLPQPENLLKVDSAAMTLRRGIGSCELWAGRVLLHDFGRADRDAEEAIRVFRTCRPTEWGRIGSPRPIVEYGLTAGEAPQVPPNAKNAIPIDRQTVQAELVRGAWVLRDQHNILLNFGPIRADAEQAAAVVKRYGFNRLGRIGAPDAVSMSYFYTVQTLESAPEKPNPAASLVRLAQEQNLTRTGVDVPGVGYVGERLVLDLNKLEVRKSQNEWVLAHGPDVLGRFGYSELTARNALRVVKDGHFTEFCRIGNPGVTFYLVNGQPPQKVPFDAQGMRFDPTRITIQDLRTGSWAVCDGTGRTILSAASREDAEQVAGVLRAYKFDQLCRVGMSPKASMIFFARVGR